MKKNMGSADRTIRFLIAALIVVLFFTHVISGTVGFVLLILAGVFVLTSILTWCPIYTILGINSCGMKKG